tara:strand:- start:2850 stop:3626 length:777 start_codon:yes stop_codon:yes gene_type:complete
MKFFEWELNSGIGILTFAREKVLNALNEDLLIEGLSFLQDQSSNTELKVLVITGKGAKSFVAGADIVELSKTNSEGGRRIARLGQNFMNALSQFPRPVIAAINGFALGGGLEVAIAADLRYASSKAKLGLPEVTLGLIPGYGGTQRLARLIGVGKANEYIFSGEMFTAEQALQDGLIQGIFEPDNLMSEVLRIAKKISARAPLALQAAKRAINLGTQLDLGSALEIEILEFGNVCGTNDMKEGTSAFLEKRQAQFLGE